MFNERICAPLCGTQLVGGGEKADRNEGPTVGIYGEMLGERQRAHAPQHFSRYDDATVIATRLQGSERLPPTKGERDVAGYRACLAGPVSVT